MMLRLYGALVRLLPAWLRERSGDAMQAAFEDQMQETDGAGRRLLVALQEMGGVLRVAATARTSRSGRMLEMLRQDIHFAVRSMRRNPGVSALAVLTLSLGIAASTAMFSVVDTILLKPLPYPEAERVVLVHAANEEWRVNHPLSNVWDRARMSYPEYAHWASAQQSYDATAAFTHRSTRLNLETGAAEITALLIMPEVFDVLRIGPAAGRAFDASDGADVVLLSDAFWRSHFGADAGVLGTSVELNERPHRIVGVLPAGLEIMGTPAEVWQPYSDSPGNMAAITNHTLLAVGRLARGVSLQQAETETGRLLHQAAEGAPRHMLTHGAALVSPLEEATREVRTPLLVLAAASLLLLAAACGNVALLLLGAGTDRVRELAVRGALGAHRGRIAMQLMVEGVALSAAATLAALPLASAFIALLVGMAPGGTPRLEAAGLDVRVFVFAAVVAALCGVLAGCFPAVSLSGVKSAESLRASTTTPGRGGLQRVIIIAELAFATTLLVGAGLLTRTLGELSRVDPGFHAEGLVALDVSLPYDRLREAGDAADFGARLSTLISELVETVGSTPGVTELALASSMPYDPGHRNTSAVEPEGYVPADGEEISVAFRFVSGNYFDVMGIPPVDGRTLTPADALPGAEPVMIVTEYFARRYWPDGRWIGRTVGWWGNSYRVAGVVADNREQDLRGDADPAKIYVADTGTSASKLLLRSALPLATLAPTLRMRVTSVDRSIVVRRVSSMDERIAASLAQHRYRMRLMQAFAGTAALFCLLGVYGVMSRSVARRHRELGLRTALGARHTDILALILREGLIIGAAGAVAGLLLAWAGARVLQHMLWGVHATDALTFVATATGLLLLALLATLLPAARAARSDPMAAFRA